MAWSSPSARTKTWGTEVLTASDLHTQLDLLHTYFNDCLNGTTGHGHTGGTNDGPKIVLTTSVSGTLPLANGGTGVTTLAALMALALPSGVIVMWSGTIATIPTGWYLCNGSNGTPDLRNQFICCADADSGGVAKTTITGSALQSHATGLVLDHTHTYTLPPSPGAGGSGASYSGIPGTQTTGGVNSGNSSSKNIPVFYALAFIMKA